MVTLGHTHMEENVVFAIYFEKHSFETHKILSKLWHFLDMCEMLIIFLWNMFYIYFCSIWRPIPQCNISRKGVWNVMVFTKGSLVGSVHVSPIPPVFAIFYGRDSGFANGIQKKIDPKSRWRNFLSLFGVAHAHIRAFAARSWRSCLTFPHFRRYLSF